MFLGRSEELGALDAALATAQAGKGCLVLIAGEPGVGKTRLAATAAAHAAAAGLRVLWGRCREEGVTPAHWPWVQVLRALGQETEPARLAAALGRGAAVLSAAVPEIGDRLAATGRAADATAPTRFVFFDAVETFLRRLAVDTPLALIFDDLHAADPSSLALLDFIAPEVSRARVLLLATYREHEASTTEAGPVIARVVRHGARIRLTGLGLDDVATLAAATAGHAVSPSVVAAIHRATEGNPLFVQEMVRTLAAKGQLSDGTQPRYLELADSVQHVIATRLEPLSAAARDALAAAAVVGRQFDVATLEAAIGVGAYELLTHLQAAVDAGIAALHGGVRGSAAFTHALYREFFYAALPAARRAALHVQVAAALEQQNAEAHLPEIAFHLLEAGPVGSPARAATYARRAGDQAGARFAYAQAVKHYEDALRALDAAAGDQTERCELLLSLGEAHFRGGAGGASKAAFRQAADMARALGDAERLAHAAFGLAGPWSTTGGLARDDVVAALEDAVAALGERDAVLRARLLARLAVELYFSETRARCGPLSEEAVTLGRRAGDPRALVEALVARHLAVSSTASLAERTGYSREAVRLARQAGDEELGFRARFQLINVLLEDGDRAALDREVASAARAAERLRQPFYLWFVAAWRAALALVDGRLDEAERLIAHAFSSGCAVQGQDEMEQFAGPVYQGQLYNLRLEQGRGLADIEPPLRTLAESLPMPVFRCFLMWLYCGIERWTDARDEFERIAADDFAVLPADWTSVICVAFAAATCADLGDGERARALYDRALPYADHHISNGSYYFGSMSHNLGRLAATTGRVAEAAEHFEAALKAHRRMGARCWLTRTQVHYAELLLHRGERRDRQRARAMLHEALERARQIGMAGVAAAAERLLAAAQAEEPAPASPLRRAADEPTSPERAVFCRTGDTWTIEFAGVARQLPDVRGLRYLQPLLQHPGREFHATELVQVALGASADSPGRAGDVEPGARCASSLGDAGPALDAQAAAAYRRRLAELREGLEEAERFNDLGRAAQARQEIEFLSAELAAAVRGRKTASHAERARLTVTKGIKSALQRIQRVHPPLARHLQATIRRGYFCSYTPDPRHPIEWQT